MSDEDRIVTLAILIASIACALIVSFICSLMEAALLSITPSQLAELKQRNHRIGTIVKNLKEDINKKCCLSDVINSIHSGEPLVGFEPTTPRLQITCSGQLS